MRQVRGEHLVIACRILHKMARIFRAESQGRRRGNGFNPFFLIVEPPPAGAGGSLLERDLPRIPHSSPDGSRGIPIRRD